MLRRAIYIAAILAVCVPAVIAQQTSQSPQNTNTPAQSQSQEVKITFTPGTLIRAEIEKSVDAKKARVGDPVDAKTIDDLESTPPNLATKGCKITGHVVEVAPHQKDTPSKLGIAFDKMELKNGTEMPLSAQIQAIGSPEAVPTANYSNQQMPNNMGGNAGAPQQSGGMNSRSNQPGGYGGTAQSVPTMSPGMGTSQPDLSLQTKGVVGMSDVTLGTGAQQESLLTSEKHNVKIDSGMEMILRTQ